MVSVQKFFTGVQNYQLEFKHRQAYDIEQPTPVHCTEIVRLINGEASFSWATKHSTDKILEKLVFFTFSVPLHCEDPLHHCHQLCHEAMPVLLSAQYCSINLSIAGTARFQFSQNIGSVSGDGACSKNRGSRVHQIRSTLTTQTIRITWIKVGLRRWRFLLVIYQYAGGSGETAQTIKKSERQTE